MLSHQNPWTFNVFLSKSMKLQSLLIGIYDTSITLYQNSETSMSFYPDKIQSRDLRRRRTINEFLSKSMDNEYPLSNFIIIDGFPWILRRINDFLSTSTKHKYISIKSNDHSINIYQNQWTISTNINKTKMVFYQGQWNINEFLLDSISNCWVEAKPAN